MTHRRGSALVIILGVFLLISICTAGYFYWQTQQKSQPPFTNIQENQQTGFPTTAPTVTPIQKPTTTEANKLLYYSGSSYGQDPITNLYKFDPVTNQENGILTLPTTKNFFVSRFVVSPDGGKIVFTLLENGENNLKKSRQLEMINTDGTNRKTIFSDNQPSQAIIDGIIWSPDSKMLIFTSDYTTDKRYVYSLQTGKLDKLSTTIPGGFPGIMAWFPNNKVAYEISTNPNCQGDCYAANKVFTSNLDGSTSQGVFTPEAKELYSPFYYLPNGEGFIRTNGQDIVKYDFATKKYSTLVHTNTTSGRLGRITFFPISNAALILVWDGDSTVYKVNLDNNSTTKLANYTGEITLGMAISGDEKQYAIQKTNAYFDSETNIEILDSSGKVLNQTTTKKNLGLLGFVN